MKPSFKFSFLALALLGSHTTASAYKRDKDTIKITHSNRKKAFSIEEQISSFKLPEGFVIELVASEKNGVINPIDMTFDDAGRLWTQTAEMYPMDPFGNTPNRTVRKEINNPKSKFWKQSGFLELKSLYKLETKGTDRVIVIDDPTKPVVGQIPSVVNGLTMPQSILPYKNGVYVAHGSEMLYFEDTDNDGKFEKPNTVLTGFSFLDSHTMSHTLVRGPGGWVHFSHGAMNLGEVTAVASGEKEQINYSKIAKFSLDGKKIEVVSSGLNNIWGFQLKADGQWYGTEANDKSHSVVPMEPMTGFLGIGNDKIRSYQPMVPVVHPFRVGGTGISGLAFSDDDNGFPKEWQNLAFLANPITNTINTVRVDRTASGEITGELLGDLLKSTDDWFRPVNIEFGPDGCLYIADWYNKVVSHNEIPRTDPTRDKSHGRIWRIRHKDQKPRTVPNLIKAEDSTLAKHLLSPIRWEMRAAWHQIADRKVVSLLPEIKEIVLNQDNKIGSRVHAIWSYESLQQFDKDFTSKLLEDSNYNVRREAVRSLASFGLDATTVTSLIEPMLDDKHCTVRSQAIRTLEAVEIDDPAIVGLLIKACKPAIQGNAMGGAYERNFERFLARKALETYAKTLSSLLNSKKAADFPVSNLLWASQALNQKDAKNLFSKFWKMRGDKPIDGKTLASISALLADKKVFKEVSPNFNNPARQKALLKLTLANQDKVNLKNLAKALTPALKKHIKSTDTADQKLAIQVEKLVQSGAIIKEIQALIADGSNSSLLNTALPVFLTNPKPHAALLTKLLKNDTLSFNTQMRIFEGLNRANQKTASKSLKSFTKDKSDTERATIVKYLSQSKEGALSLSLLLEGKMIKTTDFDIASAQGFSKNLKKNKAALAVYKAAKEREAEKSKALDAKVQNYMAAVEKLEGNPEAGKPMFGSCTQCHALGAIKNDIAPALDGSASRELHALLTAIVNPDVAVEGGYNLHQVVKKDGEINQGYLYSDTPEGITIAVMGGAKFFTPRRDIRSEDSITGKSFMPESFGAFPEQTMVDLIAYIKTLK